MGITSVIKKKTGKQGRRATKRHHDILLHSAEGLERSTGSARQGNVLLHECNVSSDVCEVMSCVTALCYSAVGYIQIEIFMT